MRPWILACILGALLLPACTRHEIVLEVKPIYITMDINIKVQQQMSSILDEIEEGEEEPPAPRTEKKPTEGK